MNIIQRRVREEFYRAHLRRVDQEINALVGILMPIGSPDELRLRSLHQEQDQYEAKLRELGVQP